MFFSSSHVCMWELDHKEGSALKNWCFQIMVIDKTLESFFGLQPVHPKGDQPWIFIGRIDAEAEAPVFWPPDENTWWANSLENTLMLGKIEGRKRRGRQDEMVGWYHQLNGHEFEQTLGDSEGQGILHAAVHGVTNSQIRFSNDNSNNHNYTDLFFNSSLGFSDWNLTS